MPLDRVGETYHACAMTSHKTPWPLIAALYLTGLIAGMQFTKISLTLGGLAQVYPGWPVAFAVSGVAVMGILFGVMAGGITAHAEDVAGEMRHLQILSDDG